MATTTPNYGWPVPTSTDYVKDGATAIEALGDAIDATVFGLPSAGFTLVTAGTYTGASTISVNNCFTTTYDFYKVIIYNDTLASSNGNVYMKFRVGGVDSSASYNSGNQAITVGGTTLNNSQNNGALGFLISQTRDTTLPLWAVSIDIQNVKLAKTTQFQGLYTGNNLANTAIIGGFFGGNHAVATAYDGFSIIAPANISGNYKVYGYRN